MTPDERYERAARRLRALQAAGEMAFGPPVSEEAILAAERELAFNFPNAFRRLLMDFGPRIAADRYETFSDPDAGALGKFLKRKLRMRSHTVMLTPGSGGDDDLIAVRQSLQALDTPPPPQLVPYELTRSRARRTTTLLCHFFDPDCLRDGEAATCLWTEGLGGFVSKWRGTFLETLEHLAFGRPAPDGADPTYKDLAARLRGDACLDQFTYADPAEESDITATEQEMGIAFPDSYKRFLADFGPAVVHRPLLSVGREDESVRRVTEVQRRSRPPLPSGLVPFALDIASAGNGRYERSYTCFDYGRPLAGEPRVTTWAPKSRRKDRRRETDQVFLDWLTEHVERAEKTPNPPDDWRSASGWDRYWRRVLESDFWRKQETERRAYGLWNEWKMLRRRSYQRILFAGNGICMEPHAFAQVGFDVTALDISPTASRHVQTAQVTEEQLARCRSFGHWVSRSEEEREQPTDITPAPGGTLAAVTGDMFTYAPEDLFDVVYSYRSVQGFAEADVRALALQFHRWVRPGGLCIVETINLCSSGQYKYLEAAFDGADFLVHGRRTEEWYEAANHPGITFLARKRRADAELEQRRADESRREEEHLASGGKVIIFSHGSG
jgi:hypothetical protein